VATGGRGTCILVVSREAGRGSTQLSKTRGHPGRGWHRSDWVRVTVDVGVSESLWSSSSVDVRDHSQREELLCGGLAAVVVVEGANIVARLDLSWLIARYELYELEKQRYWWEASTAVV